jgi:hypothetical protein
LVAETVNGIDPTALDLRVPFHADITYDQLAF